jgi:hypothetical protein
MPLRIIGPKPLELDESGRLKCTIGTIFPDRGVLYTEAPWVHAMQRAAFIDVLNCEREQKGLAPLTAEQEFDVVASSVDLMFEPGLILIRPDPERMEVSFVADELLQTIASKNRIKFLSVSNAVVRGAIQRRGENWRLSAIPTTLAEKQVKIFHSRLPIRGLPIYFYNRFTGTRWLTLESFEELRRLDPPCLAAHLEEIAAHAVLKNRMGRPELAFFAADLGRFGAQNFAGHNWLELAPDQLLAEYDRISQAFRSTVLEPYRKDDCNKKAWCDRMLSTLFLEGNQWETQASFDGLSPEFFFQVRWVPGGRIDDGEFLLDSIFEENAKEPAQVAELCDERAKGIIFNFLREYGDLEFINVGRVSEPLNQKRPQTKGFRSVYIAEFRSKSQPMVIRRFLRLLKWDVWQRLDQGKDLLQAIKESDEYTDYWLDRRLGCRQLGMSVTRRVQMHRLTEMYRGCNPAYYGQPIRSTYFEREFLTGTASDKIKAEKYDQTKYVERLAEVLGRAAATSIIVGRSLDEGTHPVFDDGDELIVEDDLGLPAKLLVADHSGAFGEYKLPLESYAKYYAGPVNDRARFVKDLKRFAEIYLTAFQNQFEHIQQDYRKRSRAFDNLFRHCRYDTAGSFAYRWECVLSRLDNTDSGSLFRAIRSQIPVLQSGS